MWFEVILLHLHVIKTNRQMPYKAFLFIRIFFI